MSCRPAGSQYVVPVFLDLELFVAGLNVLLAPATERQNCATARIYAARVFRLRMAAAKNSTKCSVAFSAASAMMAATGKVLR
jgi:hypothetical protein